MSKYGKRQGKLETPSMFKDRMKREWAKEALVDDVADLKQRVEHLERQAKRANMLD